ncbi:MAG: fructose-6-phosphate aldolase [Planctomycetes bacterium]|nr:fructose-6-phosphate aldolase [Planctomycetota bacterium]|tara:strand:+ start:2190 stop:2867 length:678 start_codon:yes stop_codon:yes gene_type:complete
MKIFLDTAITSEVDCYYKTGLIDGLTTNPSLIRKSGRNHEEVYQEMKDIGVTDISMEVIGSVSNMISEGKRLSKKYGKVATIKVPCTPDGLMACRALSEEGIRVNVTLIFSVAQAILATKAGATYVSPFVGRLDDNSFDGLKLIKDIYKVYRMQGAEAEILAASIRDVKSVSDAFANGADIVTVPASVLGKMYNHILTDKGLNIFDKDHAAHTLAMSSQINSDLT